MFCLAACLPFVLFSISFCCCFQLTNCVECLMKIFGTFLAFKSYPGKKRKENPLCIGSMKILLLLFFDRQKNIPKTKMHKLFERKDSLIFFFVFAKLSSFLRLLLLLLLESIRVWEHCCLLSFSLSLFIHLFVFTP